MITAVRRFGDGNGNFTEWQRDEGRRVTKKVHADGSFETFTYDLSGRLQTAVDALSRTITYSYGVDDYLEKVDYSDAATPDVTYAWDSRFPRPTSRVDGSATTTFTYHAYGTSTNGAGQLALVDGPLANDTQRFTYDQLGRLKKLEVLDDATPPAASYAEEYTFDARGRVTTVANNLGTTTYAFVGPTNRPSAVTSANGMQTEYDYFGTTGDFALKQIKNLSSGSTPSVISQFDYTYRQDRSIETWKLDQGGGAKTWTFGYDGALQLTAATLLDASSAILEAHRYGYDAAGNRSQVGEGTTAPLNAETNNLNQILSHRDHGPTTFAGFLDEPATVKVNGKAAKVLSTDGGAPFKFEALVDLDAGANTVVVEAKDGQNNTATKTYSVTTTGTSKKFEYDAVGNLRYEKQPNGTVIREYRWDQQNRLVRMLEGTHESVYEYDGASRRVRIKELTSGVETKNETFVWCGSRICQKRSGSTVVRSYFGNGFQESGTTNYFYTRDHLGSVREVVGNDGTTIASRLSYDPWGKVTETGAGAKSDFTYTGHYFDRPAGLDLTWFRAYDPSFGRWLSRDPIGLRGGSNIHRYVENNPVNYADPTGLMPDDRYPGMPQDETGAACSGAGAAAGGFLALAFRPLAFLLAAGIGIESEKDLWKIPFIGGLPVTNPMDAVRSRCPNGDCRILSRELINHLGEGQLIEMAPANGTKLPHRWEVHSAVELPGGGVMDPTLNASFPSAAAWQQAIAGNGNVLISRSPWPPIFGPPLPGDSL